MAREESDREDLLREATALVERVELIPRQKPTHIVAGFRTDGALSLFFGGDPVYQFNATGDLRRAYRGGLLLKAVQGRLVSLRRERKQNEVQLLTTELSDSDRAEFLEQLSTHLLELKDCLESGDFDVVGQVPADADVIGRLRNWFSNRSTWQIAARPNA